MQVTHQALPVQPLHHDPRGGGNPYGGPCGRHPAVPVPGETVEVGARAGGPLAAVAVEWESAGRRHTTAARPEEGAYRALIGPFAGGGRYRFVARAKAAGPAVEAVRSAWFDLPATSWRPEPFTGVRHDGGVIEAVFGQDVLRLVPGERCLAWSVPAGGESAAPGAAEDGRLEGSAVEEGGWKAAVEEGGWKAAVEDGWLVVDGLSTRWRLCPPVWLQVEGTLRELRLGWRLAECERLYGTGERFDAVDQRGRAPDVRVYEQYKRQGTRTYFPLPVVLSSAGYLVEVESAARVRFDLGASQRDLCTLRIPVDDGLRGRYRHGTPAQVLRDYTAGAGRPGPPPLWAYGPWMSGNEWNSEARVRQVVRRTLDEAIPATVLVIEAWSDETTFYLFDDVEYEPVAGDRPVPVQGLRHGGRWPDPKALVDWLHERGLRVLLWQIPALKDVEGHPQHDADVAYAEGAGLCVGTDRGESYRNRGWWFPGARIVDFTNPDAVAWWFRKRAWLLDDLGIDGFKTDGGEHLWGADVVTASGQRGDVAANRYPTAYLEAYHAFLRAHGHERPVTFSRAGFTGAQAYPAHWAGDEDSTWEACRAALVAGLCAGLSGIAFWGWDLAGFSGSLPPAELYRRSAALAAFCPVMQYHSELNDYREPPIDRTPWNVAEQTGAPDVIDTYRFYARLRMNLVPYLAQLGQEAFEEGLPLLRAMVLEAPDDGVAAGVEDQFFLGADLLVAPVLEPGVTRRRVYLPAGRWYDFWSGRPASPGWAEVEAPVGSIPVFARAGAVVPLWLPQDEVALGVPVGLPGEGHGADGSGRLVLMAFAGAATRRMVHPVSEQRFEVRTEARGDGLTVAAHGLDEPVALWLRGPLAGAPEPGGPGDGLLRTLAPGGVPVRARITG